MKTARPQPWHRTARARLAVARRHAAHSVLSWQIERNSEKSTVPLPARETLEERSGGGAGARVIRLTVDVHLLDELDAVL